MKFLQRFASARSADPVNEFWDWWQKTGEGDFTKAVSTGNFEPLMDPMTRRVKAIHPDLVWQACEGTSADHMLCVTAGGTKDAREHSERWYRAAPPRGTVWEFSPVTPPPSNTSDLVFLLGGQCEVPVHEFRFNVRVGTKLDVTACHELLALADQDAQAEVAFVVLDSLLGEDAVMRWIGSVDAAVEAESDAVEPWQLQSIVEAFARRRFESWQVQQQELPDGGRSLIRIRSAEWLDRPNLELHCALLLPYESENQTGLPVASELERLDAIEESLEDNSGMARILVAVETGQGRRVLHYYADPSNRGSVSVLQSCVQDNPGSGLEQAQDPFWGIMRNLRQSQ